RRLRALGRRRRRARALPGDALRRPWGRPSRPPPTGPARPVLPGRRGDVVRHRLGASLWLRHRLRRRLELRLLAKRLPVRLGRAAPGPRQLPSPPEIPRVHLGACRMADDKRALESLVLTRLMRLNATVQGVVTGLVAGLA